MATGRAGAPLRSTRHVATLIGGAAALVVVLFSLFAGNAHAAVYWTGLQGVSRANLDGSVVETDFLTVGNVCGLDIFGSKIYWVDRENERIGRASTDGSDIDRRFLSVPGSLPCHLAVDSDHIYWASIGHDAIGRADRDGSNVEPEFIAGLNRPCGVAVDGSHVYWTTEWAEGTVERVGIDGEGPPETIVEEAETPCPIAVDRSWVYWMEEGSDSISRAKLDGSGRQQGVVTGIDEPSAIALDRSHLYWVDSGGVGTGSIGRADLDGTNEHHDLIAGLRFPWGIAVDDRQLVPPAIQPVLTSNFRIVKQRRNKRTGVVYIAVDVFGPGYFDAFVSGFRVRVLPERVFQGGFLAPGRKWLKIWPGKGRGDGARCVRRALRRGLVVRRPLTIRLAELGKTLLERNKSTRFFRAKPRWLRVRATGRKPRVVGCYARPK